MSIDRCGGEAAEDAATMNGQDVHFVMIKIVSATLVYALGTSLTLGTALAAIVAILR